MQKNKYSLTRTIFKIFVFAFVCLSFKVYSQKDTNKTSEDGINIFADIVSSYMWRGLCFDLSPNIQPTFSYTKGNLEFGFWGSPNILGTYRETDLYASYSLKNITLVVYDYFSSNKSYFLYDNKTTSHIFEVYAVYEPKKAPLKITAGTLVYGDDKKMKINSISTDTTYINQYSAYAELAYFFSCKNITLELSIGGTPIKGYYAKKAGITNISLSGERNFNIDSNHKIPVKISVITNIQKKNIFMVLGVKI